MTETYLKDYLWKSQVLLQHRNLQIFWTDMWGKAKELLQPLPRTFYASFLRFLHLYQSLNKASNNSLESPERGLIMVPAIKYFISWTWGGKWETRQQQQQVYFKLSIAYKACASISEGCSRRVQEKKKIL